MNKTMPVFKFAYKKSINPLTKMEPDAKKEVIHELEGSRDYLLHLSKNPYEESIEMPTAYATTESIDIWQAMSIPVSKYVNAANFPDTERQQFKDKKIFDKSQSEKKADKEDFLKEIALKVLKTIAYEIALRSYFETRPVAKRKNFTVVMACKYFMKEVVDEMMALPGMIEVHTVEKNLEVSIGDNSEVDSELLRNNIAYISSDINKYAINFPCQAAVKILSIFAQHLNGKIESIKQG